MFRLLFTCTIGLLLLLGSMIVAANPIPSTAIQLNQGPAGGIRTGPIVTPNARRVSAALFEAARAHKKTADVSTRAGDLAAKAKNQDEAMRLHSVGDHHSLEAERLEREANVNHSLKDPKAVKDAIQSANESRDHAVKVMNELPKRALVRRATPHFH